MSCMVATLPVVIPSILCDSAQEPLNCIQLTNLLSSTSSVSVVIVWSLKISGEE